MINAKQILITLTLTTSILGIFIAKANEKKRTTYSVVYFQNSSGGWSSITAQGAFFSDQSINCQAAILDNNCILRNLFATQSSSVPVSFVRP